MHELNELELAIRSERHATLSCDGVPFTVTTVIDNESGSFVFPIESAALHGEEIVLWLPEERNDAMQILVMLEGRIAEQGTHQELLARGGWYARMFEIQKDEVDATLVTG